MHPIQVAVATYEELVAAAGAKAPLRLAGELARYPGRFNLEIKEDRAEVADGLLALVKNLRRERSVIVASFHQNVFEHFREKANGEDSPRHPERSEVSNSGSVEKSCLSTPVILSKAKDLSYTEILRSG